jgi:hypothetical protein
MTLTPSPPAAVVPRPRPGDRWQFATRVVGGASELVYEPQSLRVP